MVCIYCGSPTQVTNTRSSNRTGGTWRRRNCKACVAQFTTLESVDLEKAFVVVNSSNKIGAFNADLILIDIFRALGHRPNPVSDASSLRSSVLSKLSRVKRADPGKIKTSEIAGEIHTILKRFDRHAANYFAAYHSNHLTKQ